MITVLFQVPTCNTVLIRVVLLFKARTEEAATFHPETRYSDDIVSAGEHNV